MPDPMDIRTSIPGVRETMLLNPLIKNPLFSKRIRVVITNWKHVTGII